MEAKDRSFALGVYGSKSLIGRINQHTLTDTPLHKHTCTHAFMHTHAFTHTHSFQACTIFTERKICQIDRSKRLEALVKLMKERSF